MKLYISDIIQVAKAKVVNAKKVDLEDLVFDEIVFDTRRIVFVSNGLFVDLAENTLDSAKNILRAIEKGIRCFLTSNTCSSLPNTGIYLQVDSVLDSIQKIATQHRAKQKGTIIGITGSNGKTITKEWLSQILESQYMVSKSPGSYNSQLGVPLSVLSMQEDDQYGVFEAGISQVGEMTRLQKIINCEIGVFTNLGDAHDSGFLDREEKLKEKMLLFKNAKTVIFEERGFIEKSKVEGYCGANLVSWSFEKEHADYFVKVLKNNQSSRIEVSGKKDFSFLFSFSDSASITNVLHVVVCCLELGQSLDFVLSKLPLLESVSMRLVLKKGLRNCLIIDDSYNADLTSLRNALKFSLEQKDTRRLHLILTKFEQIKQGAVYFEKLNKILKSFGVDLISYIGKIKDFEIKDISVSYYQTRDELQEFLHQNPPENEVLLLKGARKYHLEELLSNTQSQVHRTEMIISLDAIRENIRKYKSIKQDSCKIMAVIKAGAYGSGSITLAKQLLRSGVDYLAVAYYDEAIELRKEGINSSIMIMNPDPSLTFLAEKYSLELEIYSLEQLKRIIQVQSSPIKIHIKIDSGMHRLGIEKRDVDNLLEILRNNHECKVVSIFSHFSCSENPDEDDFTRDQYQYFLDCYAMIMRALNDSTIIKHICNSSAAIRFPEYHHGMIRLGIGMYGYSGMEGAKMAHTLKTYVAQIKDIFPGDSVGYSRAYIAEEKIKIATLCIGYADGISRNLGNGNISFRINGNEVKTIGNISMDTCAVDISGFDVRVGDEVVIFDSLSKFMEIAVKSGKTSYELISGIGNRVVKSYVKEV